MIKELLKVPDQILFAIGRDYSVDGTREQVARKLAEIFRSYGFRWSDVASRYGLHFESMSCKNCGSGDVTTDGECMDCGAVHRGGKMTKRPGRWHKGRSRNVPEDPSSREESLTRQRARKLVQEFTGVACCGTVSEPPLGMMAPKPRPMPMRQRFKKKRLSDKPEDKRQKGVGLEEGDAELDAILDVPNAEDPVWVVHNNGERYFVKWDRNRQPLFSTEIGHAKRMSRNKARNLQSWLFVAGFGFSNVVNSLTAEDREGFYEVPGPGESIKAVVRDRDQVVFAGTEEECYDYMRTHDDWEDVRYAKRRPDGQIALGRMSSWVL